MDEGRQGANSAERRLQDLLAFPREDLGTELKGWLDLSQNEDRANLAQAIIALANFGGGHILIGFTDTPSGWQPAYPRPANLNVYSQDQVNGIVQRYIEPAFHCDVYHVPHPESGEYFPIVRVPGDHRVPVRAGRDGPEGRHVRQNVYYTRLPGPRSGPIPTAREWDELLERCLRARREDLLENFRSLLYGASPIPRDIPQDNVRQVLNTWTQQAQERWEALVAERLRDEHPQRYAHGVWTVTYSVLGDFQRPSLQELLEILKRVQGHETGWPPWWVPTREELKPYPWDGQIECWLVDTQFRDATHSDFWRASPSGMLFLLRGYQEDGAEGLEPGAFLDVTLPIWRIGECLLHAERFALQLAGESASVLFQARWNGLRGRTLISWADRNILFHGSQYGLSQQDVVESETTLLARDISTLLTDTVATITRPLYEIFSFYEPSRELIDRELSRMRSRGIDR
jgi:transcriptional regulator with XRE-family HTH domain